MTFLELFKQDVRIEREIPYLDDDNRRHRLDIYAPPDAENCPVVMWYYGGGWRSGDKRLFEHLGRGFAVRGIVTVAANYRLTPEVTYPANAEDCAAAVAWTHENIARYGGDPGRIFLCGHSAGAHLAAMVGLDQRFLIEAGLKKEELDDIIRGVVMISGATDLRNHVETTKFTSREHVEETFGSDEASLKGASPLTFVGPEDPPFLVIVAENDPEGLRNQGKRLADALREADVTVRFISVNGRDHFSIVRRFGSGDDPTANAAAEFINTLAAKAV